MDVKKQILLLILASLAAAENTAFGQTPPGGNRGFTPPGTSFGANPFGGKPGAKGDDLFEMEDDEDFDDSGVDDISDEILRQRMEQRLRDRAKGPGNSAPSAPPQNPSGGGGNNVDFNRASQDIGATSTAGGASTKITPGKGAGCLKLDPYTGYGPDVITNFDFPDADIVEIAKTLGRLTCLNFILDKDVKGRISVVSNSQITVGDAWKAFLTALDVNGFSLIPSGAYIRVARQRDAKDKQIKTYTGDYAPDNDLYITRVLPLKYISAEEVARVFRNFMPPNTRIISYDQTNTLIITDTGSNIKKIVDMVQLLDIEGYDEGLEVIRIRYASSQDIAKLIDQLLPGSAGGGGGGAPGAPPAGIPRFRGSGFAARKTKEGGVISHIIPDDRTNSVIVSANAKGLEQVKELIRKLDAKVTANQGGSRIHVVYLQFADAEQVATTLNNLAAGGGQRPTNAAAPGAAPTSASLFEGAIKISADKPTNSLVITGTPSDYQTISRVISKLDVPRDQVYVEAIIMEMVIDKNFELGVSVASPASGIGFLPTQDFANFLVNPLAVSGLVMGFQGGKGSKSFNIPGTQQSVTVSSIQGLVKALQTNSNTNVVATPQLLTLDNQEAQIEISENIPVPSTTAVQGAGVATSITREKVALTLKIKPQINKISNFVKLDIDQKLEDISDRAPPAGVANLAFATTSRASKTTVVVQDGDTVAMGGLTRDKVTESATKVPLLGDIPVLGWLFRSKRTSTNKTNLLVFMTPQIIKQYQHVRKILDKKLRQRDEFLEKHNGGEDPFQDTKLEMVKSLPPVEDLRSGGRVENAELEAGEDPEEAPPARILPPGARGAENGIPVSPSAPSQTLDGATAPGVNSIPGVGAGAGNPNAANPFFTPGTGAGNGAVTQPLNQVAPPPPVAAPPAESAPAVPGQAPKF